MSLSQIKFIPPHFHLLQDISNEIHIFFGGENNRIRCWPVTVWTPVFTKSVWIKEKALVQAQEQICTKGLSSMTFLKFLDPNYSTHTLMHVCALPLPSLWLYVQSACILLGCILKSNAANLGFERTEGLINGILKWVTSSYVLSWKVLSDAVDLRPLSFHLLHNAAVLYEAQVGGVPVGENILAEQINVQEGTT